MAHLARLPFFVILMGLSALAMYPPSVVALQAQDFHTARVFFYSATLLLIITGFLAIALIGFRPRNVGRSHLLTLIGAYIGLPLLFALPFYEVVRDTTFLNAYFEMVSAFTTTGATIFSPGRLADALHLWRAEVAWLGGMFLWIIAAAIFAPLNLGGFEVSATSEPGRGVGNASSMSRDLETSVRLIRVTAQLVPIYVSLTLVLWICLLIAGDRPLVAIVHAMSTLSTSGISAGTGTVDAASGFAGELLILLFLVFAISRRAYSAEAALRATNRLIDDPEMRVGALLIASVTAALFLRHFIGAFNVRVETEPADALLALWGTLFTVTSFLSTTGFVSEHWAEARYWSGLAAPSLALVGLALVGGGVATTAGGVKLLRVYALYVHGKRELGRLVHPSSVHGTGKAARAVSARGVFIAWVFFMLYALSVAVVWVALSLAGVEFGEAMVLTIAALSTTGPLAQVASEGGIFFGLLAPEIKVILMAAMILGRLETLVLIALLNAEFWRG